MPLAVLPSSPPPGATPQAVPASSAPPPPAAWFDLPATAKRRAAVVWTLERARARYAQDTGPRPGWFNVLAFRRAEAHAAACVLRQAAVARHGPRFWDLRLLGTLARTDGLALFEAAIGLLTDAAPADGDANRSARRRRRGSTRATS